MRKKRRGNNTTDRCEKVSDFNKRRLTFGEAMLKK